LPSITLRVMGIVDFKSAMLVTRFIF
jgi:hypothetical protein